MANPGLIYILAASHSGSTLSAMLLNAHPRICTVGELKLASFGDAEEYRCSCLSALTECDFWTRVQTEMAKRGRKFSLDAPGTDLGTSDSQYINRVLRPLHRGRILEAIRDLALSCHPEWSQFIEHWRAQNLALIQSVAKCADAQFVVDSSKTAVRLKYLTSIDGLRIRVIRLIRDGRGVALTYMNSSAFADSVDPDLRGGGAGRISPDRLPMEDAALRWRRSNEEVDEVFKTIDASARMTVRYEDLCSATAETLAKIHNFLEVPPDQSHLLFRDASHHVVGNGMRLDSSSAVVLDERWRDELSEGDLTEFERVAGNLNRAYGYQEIKVPRP